MAHPSEAMLRRGKDVAAADHGIDRTTLRVGSVCAAAGAGLAVAFSILDPKLDFDDPVVDQLRVMSESDGWIVHHLGTLLFTLLITAALYVVSRTLVDRGVEVWRHLAVGSLLVSTPVAFITVALRDQGVRRGGGHRREHGPGGRARPSSTPCGGCSCSKPSCTWA